MDLLNNLRQILINQLQLQLLVYQEIEEQQEEIEGTRMRQEVNQLRHASVLTDNQDENLKHLHRVWIYRCRWIDHVNLLRQVKQMKVNLNVCW